MPAINSPERIAEQTVPGRFSRLLPPQLNPENFLASLAPWRLPGEADVAEG
jgi:hypothetical protein